MTGTATELAGEIKTLAERMGYHWAANTDPAVPFAGFMYKKNVIISVTAKKLRYGLSEDCIIEKKLPDEIAQVRSLPLPPYVIREFWVRTQNERAFRRFYVLAHTTAEIQENTKEGYRNTHYREEYWKKAPYRLDIFRDREGGDEGDGQKTP